MADTTPRGKRWLTLLLAVALAVPAQAAAFSPEREARNFDKPRERHRHETGSPEYQAMLRQRGAEREAELAGIRASDPERGPDGICSHHTDACAGDVQFYSWQEDGHGLRVPVLYTAASGATISGHLWATRAGPARRPGILITPGSVQAPEELYAAAATLAKRGYVVMTYDVQMQGYSDVRRARPDEDENSQAQDPNAFLDGARDSLDFFLSAPPRRYVPRPSRSSGTVHADKQDRRVASGLNAAFNPLWDLVDPERIGLAGHSLGAYGVSDYGSRDPRVDAIVAWDKLTIAAGRCSAGRCHRSSRASPPSVWRPTTASPRRPTRTTRAPSRSPPPRGAGARPAWTPARSSSAAARTSSSPKSRTRSSTRPCAEWTWPPGTPPPGSTST
ncbi:MAG: hypothetical protein M3340_08590 [Actinomycetota bacterium]|nr:hypothetical protein [Actinomycetota bacterium]